MDDRSCEILQNSYLFPLLNVKVDGLFQGTILRFASLHDYRKFVYGILDVSVQGPCWPICLFYKIPQNASPPTYVHNIDGL